MIEVQPLSHTEIWNSRGKLTIIAGCSATLPEAAEAGWPEMS